MPVHYGCTFALESPYLTALHDLSEGESACDRKDMETTCHLEACENLMALLSWQEAYLSPRLQGEIAEAPAERSAHNHFKLR